MTLIRGLVRSLVSSPVRSLVRGDIPFEWADSSGVDALHAWDFTTNKARFNSSYIGALSNTPNWTYTRADAQSAYAETSAGVLTPFATGVLRRTDKGVLIEGARTNLLLRSQELGTTWTLSAATVTADAIAAPDGTVTADKIVPDTSSSNAHQAGQSISFTNAQAYTLSCYAKAGEYGYINLLLPSTAFGGTNQIGTFNLLTGVCVATLGAPTVTIRALGNGWYFCAITATAGSTTSAFPAIRVNSTYSNAAYTGDGASGAYAWGAQLEAATFASSYIPTTSASATRAADTLTVTGLTGLSYPLTVFADFTVNRVSTLTPVQNAFQIDDGTNNNRLNIRASDFGISTGYSRLIAVSAASMIADLSVGSSLPTVDVPRRIAFAGGLDDFRAAVGGTLLTPDVSGAAPAAPTRALFGESLFGYIRRVAIFNRALTDAQLQTIST